MLGKNNLGVNKKKKVDGCEATIWLGYFDRPPAFGKVSGKSVEGARTFSIRCICHAVVVFCLLLLMRLAWSQACHMGIKTVLPGPGADNL